METRRNWQAGLLALLLLWLALPGLALAQEAGWDAQKAHIATLIRNGDPTSLDQAQPLLFDQLIPKATALFGPTSDREWKAEILAAQWHRKMGQFDEAEARLVAAIERAHALAYSGQELMNLYIEICGIFSHLANQGHTDKWQDYALYAPTVIDLSNRPENRFEAALNMVVASQGDQQDLEYWLRKARGMLHQISQPEQLSLFYRMEGQHLLGLGAWPAAERSLSLADSCYQLLDKRFALEHIDCLVMLADAKLSLGRPEGVPALVGRARVLMDTDGMLTAQMKDRRVLFGGFLLQNEAEYHMREGRFEVALPLLWTSFEELKAAKSRYAATSLILIQECHMGLGQWHMADSMADSVPTWKAFSDPNSQAAMLLNMALIDAHFGRVSQAARQFALMDSISGENFGKALRELDEVVSHSLRDRPFRRQNAFFFDFASRHPELGFDSLLYDRELLHKSALVQNERALRQYIENHPDTTIRQHWRKMKESEAKDARWYQEQLSSRLVDAPGNLGFSPVGWRQVRQALGPRQAAIEFVEVPTVRGLQPTDTTRLAALLLRPGQQPRLIPLCMGHELDEAFEPADQASVYRADSEDPELFPNDLHALIWEPIAPFLEGVDTVFYAPAGRLHSVNLGAMPTPQGGRAAPDPWWSESRSSSGRATPPPSSSPPSTTGRRRQATTWPAPDSPPCPPPPARSRPCAGCFRGCAPTRPSRLPRRPSPCSRARRRGCCTWPPTAISSPSWTTPCSTRAWSWPGPTAPATRGPTIPRTGS